MNVKAGIWLSIGIETRFHMLGALARYQRKTRTQKGVR
jgi:hypothetical protein